MDQVSDGLEPVAPGAGAVNRPRVSMRPAPVTEAHDQTALGYDSGVRADFRDEVEDDADHVLRTAKCPRPRSMPTTESVSGSVPGSALDHEGREVPAGRVLDHGHGGRHGGQVAQPLHPHVADLRHRHVPARGDLPSGVGCEPYGLPMVLARLEPRRAHTRPLTLQAVEEVPLGGIQVPQGLLQHDRRHLAEPRPPHRLLRLGDQQLGQVPVFGNASPAAREVSRARDASLSESLHHRAKARCTAIRPGSGTGSSARSRDGRSSRGRSGLPVPGVRG